MRLQGDIGLYLSGCEVRIPSCGMLFITQPKIKDIVKFGEMDFLTMVRMIGSPDDFFSSIKEGNSELKEFDNFQILLEVVKASDPKIQEAFNKFFELCFPEYDITLTKNSIEFRLREDDKKTMVGQVQMYNFQDFSTVVRELFDSFETQKDKFNPSNELARKIAEKLEKARNRKAKDKKSSNNQSIFSLYTSVLSIGLQIDINILYNYTPFQIYDTFARYIAKQQSDLYQKIALQPFASTDSLEEPEN
jgi:hypothetical protein